MDKKLTLAIKWLVVIALVVLITYFTIGIVDKVTADESTTETHREPYIGF